MEKQGYFGIYGGRYVCETLMPALLELEEAYLTYRSDKQFLAEFQLLLKEYVGRPTPLYLAKAFAYAFGKEKIYLKREDLCHTGAHKINNALGQALLAKRMGKKRIIAETGAGQHGVATATVSALFGMDCEIYMGSEDIKRQHQNVLRMRLLGAKVRPVTSGTNTLKDAMNEALRDWVTNVQTTFYLIGSVAGPHPYPSMVKDFQKVIGEETRKEILDKEGRLPDYLIACVGGGSNAIGLFYPFLGDKEIKIFGVEGGGLGLGSTSHSSSIGKGRVGVLHGAKSYVLQDEWGQILPAHSIAPGLDYPGVGPEHSYFHDTGRIGYHSITDKEALEGFRFLAEKEGIIPALESSHAIAFCMKIAHTLLKKDDIVIINLSGRGDKDLGLVSDFFSLEDNKL